MPLFARHVLLILLSIASIACILLPLVLGLWQTYAAPARYVPARPVSKELLGTVLGMLFADLLAYVMYRPDLPRNFFYGFMVGLNGLCLLFVCYGFVAWWLYQRAIRHVPVSSSQQVPATPLEDEVVTSVQTTSV